MAKRAQENFNEVTMTSFSNGVYTKLFNGDREELLVVNDGNADLTITAGAIKNFKLKPGEIFDEEVNPFSRLEITATGSFRGYVREDTNSPT